MADILPPLSLITTCFVVIRLSGGVSQQSISEGSDGKRMRVPSGPEVFTGMYVMGFSLQVHESWNACSYLYVPSLAYYIRSTLNLERQPAREDAFMIIPNLRQRY